VSFLYLGALSAWSAWASGSTWLLVMLSIGGNASSWRDRFATAELRNGFIFLIWDQIRGFWFWHDGDMAIAPSVSVYDHGNTGPLFHYLSLRKAPRPSFKKMD